jgi:hypothetical protein
MHFMHRDGWDTLSAIMETKLCFILNGTNEVLDDHIVLGAHELGLLSPGSRYRGTPGNRKLVGRYEE